MRKIIIFLILAVLLVAGSIKGALWYSVKSRADKFITMVAPFVSVRYDKVHAAYDGSLGLDGIHINGDMGNVKIASIRMKAENLMELLELRNQLESGYFPKTLALQVNQLELNYGSVLNNLYKAHENSPFTRLNALGCGNLNYFHPSDLKAMGYEKLVSSIELSYLFDPGKGIVVTQEVKIEDMMDLTANYIIKGIGSQSIQDAIMARPELSRMSINAVDHSYIQKVNNYCAGLNGGTVEEYIDKHLLEVEALLDVNGVYPGEGLMNAYQDYLRNGKSFAVSFNMTSRTPVSQWHLYKADVVMEHFLEFQLSVNEKPVKDLSLSWDWDRAIAAMNGEILEVEEEKEEAVIIEVPVEYHKANFEDLKNYRSHKAKILTKKGKEYFGIIVDMTDSVVELRVKQLGGSIGYHIRKQNAENIEILY